MKNTVNIIIIGICMPRSIKHPLFFEIAIMDSRIKVNCTKCENILNETKNHNHVASSWSDGLHYITYLKAGLNKNTAVKDFRILILQVKHTYILIPKHEIYYSVLQFNNIFE